MLSNYRLLSCNGNELTLEELNKLFEFYNMMSGSLNSRFIYRGESDRNLMRQFNVDTKTPEMLYIFKEGELEVNSVRKESLLTAADGKKYRTNSIT